MARNLVNLEAVHKAYGTRVLLDGVALGVAEGERIGVVGRNGGGKSTLLRLLAGAEPPDDGRVTHTGGLRVAAVSQHDDLDPADTVRAAVVGHGPAHAWASDAQVRAVLAGLFGERADLDAMLDRQVGPLSGGECRRVALAAALVGEHDLLVLDEPTNHLDVEGIDWLARHLAVRREALVVVTHDRWFLDALCTRTWEVHDGRVDGYDGGYAAYVLARAERARLQVAADARRANVMRKELAWLRRGPPARTSKPRFRIEAANALIADEPPPRDSVELVRFASARLGRTVYELHDVTLRAGDRVLLDRLSWKPRAWRPGRGRRRERVRQDLAAAPAHRRAGAGGGARRARGDGAPGVPLPGGGRARPHAAPARGGRGRTPGGVARARPRGDREPAVRALWLHRQRPVDAGRPAVRG